MRSRVETGRRLTRRRHRQMVEAVAIAGEQARLARQMQEEASSLRAVAKGALEGLRVEELGLSRTDLFGQLRGLAILRARALESESKAASLLESARECMSREAQARQEAAAHHRRKKKIEAWCDLKRAQMTS